MSTCSASPREQVPGTTGDPSTSQAARPHQGSRTGAPAKPRRDPATALAGSSFSVGMLLLPSELQADARRLYYVLRTIDDLVDEGDPQAPERVESIERWARGAEADGPEARMLADLAQRHPFRREVFADFCKGMRLDLDEAEMKTEGELERYCEYAGGTVGVMLTALFGASHRDAERRMLALGAAMQWTNILRDIDEDLARGRVYIATSTIERYGFPHPGQREDLLRDQIARADALFEAGLMAIPMLRNGSRAMEVSVVLYREILRQIERDGFGRSAGRAIVPSWRKRLIVRGICAERPARHDGGTGS
jgi:phytoene synthase